MAGTSAIVLALVMSGAVAAAGLITTAARPATEVTDPAPDTSGTWEDIDGNDIDDDCQAVAAAPDETAAAAADAAIDLNGDGIVSTSEAAHSGRIGGPNCNHGGYVSEIAKGKHTADCATNETPDASDPEAPDDSQPAIVLTSASSDEDDQGEDADQGDQGDQGEDADQGGQGQPVVDGGGTTTCADTATATTAAADHAAAKDARKAAHDAAKAQREVDRAARKAEKAAAHQAKHLAKQAAHAAKHGQTAKAHGKGHAKNH
jgi:hypothetical protein